MATDPEGKLRAGAECLVDIHRFENGGKGVGSLPATTTGQHNSVFVPRSAPGDLLRVRVTRVRRQYLEAEPLEILAAGPDRIDPVCPHWHEGCGGCSWQHLRYSAQLSAKAAEVKHNLAEVGGFQNLAIDPIVAADEPWFYRNKMEFTFNAHHGLGLHVAGDWRRVVPVTDCRLESALSMQILSVVRQFVDEHQLSSWDPATSRGLLHELVIRHARGSGETMVGLVTSPDPFPEVQSLASVIARIDNSIVSVVHGARSRHDRASPMTSIRVLDGRDVIIEQIGTLSFHIGLETFFQTNTTQAERMLRMAETAVKAKGQNETVPNFILDVFCGVGFFTLGLARHARTVVGIELLESSINTARKNAELNQIDNALFYSGDARRTIPYILEQHGTPDIIVLDPPRSGAGGKVIRRIARAEPSRIVYVSCNPQTLASDLKELKPFGYEINRVQPIDLFPHTYHVETIVTLDRSSGNPASSR
ncbi:MAG: 23S rRNA (uracil(1939)-C(5))-methyltransferase RlmD [Acidobacteriota bacterium]|nr:23S rRNA (uracil(1939)-C(5))-methyltransferase RlmD [Acidobacteriota bacterium]